MHHSLSLESISRRKAHCNSELPSQTIAKLILAEFSKLPMSPEVALFANYARVRLENAAKGEYLWQDSLLFAGVALVHAKIHAGMFPRAQQITDSIYYVENNHGWNEVDFAKNQLTHYKEGWKQAKTYIPDSILTRVASFHPQWFEDEYGIPHTSELLQVVLNPIIVMLPFDHYEADREFFKHCLGYPSNFDRMQYLYMKAWDYPNTIWYCGSREENDYPNYVHTEAKKMGQNVSQMLQTRGRHEATHSLAIDPIVRLAKLGRTQCWLTEGVVIFLSEPDTHSQKLSEITCVPEVKQIADTTTNRVDYNMSLLLTMALCKKLSGGGDLTVGLEIIINRVANLAESVLNGHETKIDDLALLFVIDPSLHDQNEMDTLQRLMNDMLITV